MQHGKNVLIPYELFCALIHYFLGGETDQEEYIVNTLKNKANGLIERDNWINENIKK